MSHWLSFGSVSLAIVLLALNLPIASAAPKPDETPAAEDEWGFHPADGETVARNPAPFVWRPQENAHSYIWQCAQSEDFSYIDYEQRNISLNVYCPNFSLKPDQTWYWRFAFVTAGGEQSEFSSVRQFHVPKGAVAFPKPTDEDLLARIPQHPRLFLRPEDLPRLRRQARGPLRDRYQALLERCESLLKDPPDIAEPPKYPEGMQRGSPEWREIWWGNRRRVQAVTDGAATLAFTYLLSEDERFAAEARRLILASSAWDPKGATGYRYNDEAGMPAAYYTCRTYTWLYHYLSEEDREAIRRHMAVRGKEMYDHLRGRNHTWKPYGSHANRAWHFLGEIGITFYRELPEAADWVSYANNIFWTVYPVWSDSDGGWHEGSSYWSSYMNRVTWWLDIMRAAFNIDPYRRPFFHNVGAFAMYVVPPGIEDGGFGDLTAAQRASKLRPLMAVFARHAQNPHWQWYVEQAGDGEEISGGYVGFLRATLRRPTAEAPTDLPPSKLFAGTGVAVFHTDLLDRSRDVQFEFKSSRFGAYSHGYESQNSFLLAAWGKPLLIRTGRRDSYGSAHHKNWMWQTRSVNCILVNGQGQRTHSMASQGKITDFETSHAFDYVEADATKAYEGRLKRFVRRVLFVKPEAFVIWDELEAPEPATYQWLLHAPTEFAVDGTTAGVTNGPASVKVTWLTPDALSISQTNQFDPPPYGRELEQWHLTAETPEPAAATHFVTVLQPYRTGDPVPQPPALEHAENALVVSLPLAGTKTTVVLNPTPTEEGAEPEKVTYGDIEVAGRVAAVRYDTAGKPQAIFASTAGRVASKDKDEPKPEGRQRKRREGGQESPKK